VTALRTIQELITGEEDLGDLARPEEVLAQFCRTFNGRDLALLEQNRDASDEAVMHNPLGRVVRGWPKIKFVYKRLFPSPSHVRVEDFDYTIHAFDNSFFAVGRSHSRLLESTAPPRLRSPFPIYLPASRPRSLADHVDNAYAGGGDTIEHFSEKGLK
jgi:hypothetical protein